VIAKRSFRAKVLEIYVALENDLGMRRHFQIHRFALDELDGLLAQESCEQKLIQVLGQWQHAAEHRDGLGADRDCDFEPASLPRFSIESESLVALLRRACLAVPLPRSFAIPPLPMGEG